MNCIYINNKIEDEDELRLLYFHEIAHSILHKGINSLDRRKSLPHLVSKYEKEADLFVAEYLLDDDVFDRYYGESLEDIARNERVTMKYVVLNMENRDS